MGEMMARYATILGFLVFLALLGALALDAFDHASTWPESYERR